MPTKAPVKKSASARKTRGRTNAAKRKAPTVDLSKSYNEFKNFEGQQYSGMKVGRSHRWHYDKGEWKETKITPDLWEISYAVTKRRVGKAPEGSGVPVGTEYHWYILAHQNVRKLDANDYTTSLTGLKFKLAPSVQTKENGTHHLTPKRSASSSCCRNLLPNSKKKPCLSSLNTRVRNIRVRQCLSLKPVLKAPVLSMMSPSMTNISALSNV
ncbi:MAG: hypothetical protein ACXVBF_11205 [Flavisolibacter sp.]